LLLSIAFYAYWPILAVVLWWIGTLLQASLTFYTIRFWIQTDYEIKNCNPAWFIPVVGNILIPILGVDLLPKAFSLFFYSIGMFFWVILFTVIFYRLIFHLFLPAKLVPTLMIFIAPAAVGFISYMRIAQSWDIISMGLLALTYFFVIFLSTMYGKFLSLPFTLSWWAFTFPMAAATIASTVAFQVTHNPFFQIISWVLLCVTTVIITMVLVTTIKHVKIGDLCLPEN
jgi:tellurite resistance protein